ncbi:alkylation response protein AidB-like acyl-CoA dehydrogenase [Variovorax sp. Sphag1AA]|nr:alkylation response protein AidB-like acyl-CoA dehydrogenase [Variovorax sp. Sphag1AA]
MVNRFMETEVKPAMDGYEKRREFPRDLVRKAGVAGLYGAVFPESVGGSDMGYLAAAVIQEETVRNDVRFASCNNQQGSTSPSAIYFGGTPEQIRKYVPNLVAGKTIGMMSLTESGGSSDAEGNMKTFQARWRCLSDLRSEDVGLHGQRNRCVRVAGPNESKRRCQRRNCLHCSPQEIPRLECHTD